jgi:hypothetical protein
VHPNENAEGEARVPGRSHHSDSDGRQVRAPPHFSSAGSKGYVSKVVRLLGTTGSEVAVTRQTSSPGIRPNVGSEIVKEEGAAIVDGMASSDLMESIEAELRPHLDATPLGPDDFSGVLTQRTVSLIARSPCGRQLRGRKDAVPASYTD